MALSVLMTPQTTSLMLTISSYLDSGGKRVPEHSEVEKTDNEQTSRRNKSSLANAASSESARRVHFGLDKGSSCEVLLDTVTLC